MVSAGVCSLSDSRVCLVVVQDLISAQSLNATCGLQEGKSYAFTNLAGSEFKKHGLPTFMSLDNFNSVTLSPKTWPLRPPLTHFDVKNAAVYAGAQLVQGFVMSLDRKEDLPDKISMRGLIVFMPSQHHALDPHSSEGAAKKQRTSLRDSARSQASSATSEPSRGAGRSARPPQRAGSGADYEPSRVLTSTSSSEGLSARDSEPSRDTSTPSEPSRGAGTSARPQQRAGSGADSEPSRVRATSSFGAADSAPDSELSRVWPIQVAEIPLFGKGELPAGTLFGITCLARQNTFRGQSSLSSMFPASLQSLASPLRAPSGSNLLELYPEDLQDLLRSIKPNQPAYWRGLARIVKDQAEENDNLDGFLATYCLKCDKFSGKCTCATQANNMLAFSPFVTLHVNTIEFTARLKPSVVCSLRRDYSDQAAQAWVSSQDKTEASRRFCESLEMIAYASVCFVLRDGDIRATIYKAYKLDLTFA